jgi:hypothetical protein
MSDAERRDGTRRNWRDWIETVEVDNSDAQRLAALLFRKSFGHPVPPMPRHFLMLYRPPLPPGADATSPAVIGYAHQLAYENVYLAGGMCIDPGIYRLFPRWLFEQVKVEGGLATIIMKESIAKLGDCPAVFGHVGDRRARLADLRAGFVDTGRRYIMVNWRKTLSPSEQEMLLDRIEAIGPF